MAIELGANLTALMEKKLNSYDNFHIVNADFETHRFGVDCFDLVYAATVFQWIPERIGYPKAYEILKPGGGFAMFMTLPDPRPSGGYTEAPLLPDPGGL